MPIFYFSIVKTKVLTASVYVDALLAGAEVGVHRGNFSRHFLSSWQSNSGYYMIDVWDRTVGYDSNRMSDYEAAQSAVAAFGNR